MIATYREISPTSLKRFKKKVNRKRLIARVCNSFQFNAPLWDKRCRRVEDKIWQWRAAALANGKLLSSLEMLRISSKGDKLPRVMRVHLKCEKPQHGKRTCRDRDTCFASGSKKIDFPSATRYKQQQQHLSFLFHVISCASKCHHAINNNRSALENRKRTQKQSAIKINIGNFVMLLSCSFPSLSLFQFLRFARSFAAFFCIYAQLQKKKE